jgi:hypothetical protein
MKMPSHSTVVAYVALFVAIGGSAYAVSKIDSGDIRNRSIKGKDVANGTLGGRQIDERELSPPRAAGAEVGASCNPLAGGPTDCVSQAIKLRPSASLLVIATGSKGAQSGSGICAVAVDGASSASQFLGAGEWHDGFAITKTTSQLPAGPHTVSLQCTESNPDLTIDNPTIAAVAVTTDNH